MSSLLKVQDFQFFKTTESCSSAFLFLFLLLSEWFPEMSSLLKVQDFQFFKTTESCYSAFLFLFLLLSEWFPEMSSLLKVPDFKFFKTTEYCSSAFPVEVQNSNRISCCNSSLLQWWPPVLEVMAFKPWPGHVCLGCSSRGWRRGSMLSIHSGDPTRVSNMRTWKCMKYSGCVTWKCYSGKSS